MLFRSTYTVSAQDVIKSDFFSQEFFEKIENGEYLFVDEHFVYNAPLYIDHKENGALTLSEYALSHIDECCIKFTWEAEYRRRNREGYFDGSEFCCGTEGRWNGSGQGIYFDGYTPEGIPDVTFRIVFNNGWNNSPPGEQVAMRQKALDEQMDIRRKMTDDPDQCMNLLLEWRGMNYTELGGAIDRDPKTIRRTISGETTPRVETAVLICFALHLPPLISSKLLEVLRCPLSVTNRNHQWIQEALYLKYSEPVDAVREYLVQYGVKL